MLEFCYSSGNYILSIKSDKERKREEFINKAVVTISITIAELLTVTIQIFSFGTLNK